MPSSSFILCDPKPLGCRTYFGKKIEIRIASVWKELVHVCTYSFKSGVKCDSSTTCINYHIDGSNFVHSQSPCVVRMLVF